MYGGVTGKAGDRLPMSILARRGPSNYLRGSENPSAAQLAPLKQCSPNFTDFPALLGHAEGARLKAPLDLP